MSDDACISDPSHQFHTHDDDPDVVVYQKHGRHYVRPGTDRTMCDNLVAIFEEHRQGECSVCRNAIDTEREDKP